MKAILDCLVNVPAGHNRRRHNMTIHPNIAGTLVRAEELHQEQIAEYKQALDQKQVTDRAIQLTHEIVERLRSVLDRTARRYWEIHIAPCICDSDRSAASVYFPIAPDKNGFDSILGRWRWKSVRAQHQPVYDYMLGVQPFTDADNQWLAILGELAIQGKHIDLVPQTRTEAQHVTVSGAQGSVSWRPRGVTFGKGVRIMGAPVNPATQRIDPIPGVTEKVKTWVSFLIESHGVNAAGFCKDACARTRQIATEMSEKYGL